MIFTYQKVKKMIYLTPHSSYTQEWFTTTTLIFLKLSKAKILPRAAVHTKNATLEGALPLKILFQGNEKPIGMDNT